MWDRLLELRDRSGMTILLTTHDMEEADALCGELAILHWGVVAVSGRSGRAQGRAGREHDAR